MSEVNEIIMTLAIGLAFVSCYIIWQRYQKSRDNFLLDFLIFFSINTFYLTITKIAAFLPQYQSLLAGNIHHFLGILPIVSTYFYFQAIRKLKKFCKSHPLIWLSYSMFAVIIIVFSLQFFAGDNELLYIIFAYSFLLFQIYISSLLLAPDPKIQPSQRKAQLMVGIYYISVLVLYLAAFLSVEFMFIDEIALDFIYALSKIITCAAPVLFLDHFLRLWRGGTSRVSLPSSTLDELSMNKYSISKREREVIQLICQGKSNKEIAEELYISVSTVKDHVHNILKKTNADNRVQLTILFRCSSHDLS